MIHTFKAGLPHSLCIWSQYTTGTLFSLEVYTYPRSSANETGFAIGCISVCFGCGLRAAHWQGSGLISRQHTIAGPPEAVIPADSLGALSGGLHCIAFSCRRTTPTLQLSDHKSFWAKQAWKGVSLSHTVHWPGMISPARVIHPNVSEARLKPTQPSHALQLCRRS
ncbi:hypothetical protein BaRGS_00006848 [Batillaria attramentaria]|uniref:Uncharacterized protein n=1 Tax=Batillaria attramentaria TaxID=370345 RepID=A0ABD0LSH0_9CAEN